MSTAARTLYAPTPVSTTADPITACIVAAQHELDQACRSESVIERHRCARAAARRGAEAVLTARSGRPLRHPGTAANRRVFWALLADVAPELGEWAQFFAATDLPRPADAPVSAREADDLVRAARDFLDRVCRAVSVATPSVIDLRLAPAH